MCITSFADPHANSNALKGAFFLGIDIAQSPAPKPHSQLLQELCTSDLQQSERSSAFKREAHCRNRSGNASEEQE